MNRRRLTLEFAPGARNTPRWRVALLLASLLIGALVAWLLTQTLAGNARQAAELARLTDRQPAPVSGSVRQTRPDPGELARIQWVRQTSQSLMTPWGELLAALEAAPSNVALLAVEPSPARRSISLTAEAASAKDMLDYVRALQGDTRLSGVLLVSHQVQLQAQGTPLRFQVQANWGATP